MVRPVLILLGVVAFASPAAAQDANGGANGGVNWRNAGGDLFAGAAPTEAPSPGPGADLLEDRLDPPDQPHEAAITAAAERHGLDRKLLHALVIVESAYRVRACSPAGACGLTQLMPGTAAELGVRDRFDPTENLRGGADYLARQIRRFGDLRLALAAYNAGPNRVARLGRIPNIPETRAYVTSVINCYLALTAGRPIRTSRECVPTEPGL